MSVEPDADMSFSIDQGQYEDELLWGDDPNKHYFRYFMGSNRILGKDEVQECENSHQSSQVDDETLESLIDPECSVDQEDVSEITNNQEIFKRLESPVFHQVPDSLTSTLLNESKGTSSIDYDVAREIHDHNNNLPSLDGSFTTIRFNSDDAATHIMTSSKSYQEKLSKVATGKYENNSIDDVSSRNEEAANLSRKRSMCLFKIFVALALMCCIGGLAVGVSMLLSEKRSKIASNQQSIDTVHDTKLSNNRTETPTNRSPTLLSRSPTKFSSLDKTPLKSPSSSLPSW
jgi:hypothetical protein